MSDSNAIITGPINNSRKKADLQAICDALALSATGTVPILVGRIKEHLKKTPDLVNNPRFLPLFAYRSGQSSKAQVKNSADKTLEDLQESKKDTPAATGYANLSQSPTNTNELIFCRANKTLLNQNVKIDPPPQFGRLGVPLAGNKISNSKNAGENGEGMKHSFTHILEDQCVMTRYVQECQPGICSDRCS